MLHIWYVMFSSQLCWLSTREIMSASLLRTTASECRGLPNALRWLTHLNPNETRRSALFLRRGKRQLWTNFMHSSTTSRCARTLMQHITHRSWLKLLSITKMPPPFSPSVFSTGTWTRSNVTYAVPAEDEYDVLIAFVETPSPRSTRMTVKPSYARPCKPTAGAGG